MITPFTITCFTSGYRLGNKTDEDYIRESKELNAAIKKAQEDIPSDPNDRDLSKLKEILETNFKTIYNTLDLEEKRRFWRSILKEIHIEGNEVVDITFI